MASWWKARIESKASDGVRPRYQGGGGGRGGVVLARLLIDRLGSADTRCRAVEVNSLADLYEPLRRHGPRKLKCHNMGGGGLGHSPDARQRGIDHHPAGTRADMGGPASLAHLSPCRGVTGLLLH